MKGLAGLGFLCCHSSLHVQVPLGPSQVTLWGLRLRRKVQEMLMLELLYKIHPLSLTHGFHVFYQHA